MTHTWRLPDQEMSGVNILSIILGAAQDNVGGTEVKVRVCNLDRPDFLS
jgi:hypothetical protein